MAILEVVKVSKRFGGLEALSSVDFSMESGEILGLIGPNGAGKTTLFNVISGVMKPSDGRIIFRGEDITGKKPYQIARKGLMRTLQATRLFSNLTVLENVRMACQSLARGGILGEILGLASAKQREKEMLEVTQDVLKQVGLEACSAETAKNLPHGFQRALGVAMALAPKPKLLCLDEPVTGMNLEEIRFMTNLIQSIRQTGITILVIEHHMRVIMGICDRIVALNFGKMIAEGSPEHIQNNPNVIQAYLGRPEDYVA
jgi:branched-chain amino acid transport system ATP-binding protein